MIEGTTLKLIGLDENLCHLSFAWINDPMLRDSIGSKYPVNLKEHILWFENICLDVDNKTFGIQLNCGETIGMIGIKNIDYLNQYAEIFIYLGNSKHRGKGYGTEAINLMCTYYFDTLNLHKINSFVFDYNIASQKMFLKAGFEQEGLLKKHWFRKGEFHDVYLFAKLRDTYE